ncbi:hypothetical protein CAC42_5633 [Sphaceloma murrayae]|uniref:N-acetyltransferase domain-containing protein n=1 Tax=Sphaceloma murrayae TaxID=2082308 RepID=A0A2K1QZ38_9PEZI|nr:hypothetical protein CAC42_5633 [Sphaceloma murrayae]
MPLPELHEIDPSISLHLIPSLLTLLRTRLPFSIPLYRRIQFAHFTPPTRIITSFPLSSLPASPPCPWFVAYSDPDRGPETQIFLYGSWETARPSDADNAAAASPESPNITVSNSLDPLVPALLRALVLNLRDSNLYHPANHTEEMKARIRLDRGDQDVEIKHHALLGSVHETTARILQGFGILDPEFVDDGSHGTGDRREGMPERCNKWVFDLGRGEGQEDEEEEEAGRGGKGQVPGAEKAGLPERYSKWVFDIEDGAAKEAMDDVELPDGLKWGRLRKGDYALLRSRTGIYRQDRTLEMLPSVAIYPVGDAEDIRPIGWTLLGVDASLTTLHVEPQYRGKGLAKKLARKVWTEHLNWYVQKFIEDGKMVTEKLAHADVATWNKASNGVCKSLGGYTEWGDYWFRADLDKI